MRVWICLLIGVLSLCPRVNATVEGWEIVGDPSRVAVNYSSNNGYYPRTWPLAFRFQVAALEAVRRDLVLEGKLENEPIVIQIPDQGFTSHFQRTRLALETVALISADIEMVLPARRYVIEWNDKARPKPTQSEFFDGLLALTLGLQKLNGKQGSLLVTRRAALATEYSAQIAKYQKIVQYLDPHWSPDGRFLAFTVGKNARVDYQLLDVKRRVLRQLPPLESAPAGRPQWSKDGRFLAYADLRSVLIFDTKTSQTQILKLPHSDKFSLNEVLLKFGEENHRSILFISRDTNLFDQYITCRFDPAARRATSREENGSRPKDFPNAIEEERRIETRRAASPQSDWVAVADDKLDQEHGLRRFELRSAKTGKSFSVADLPVEKVPPPQTVSLEPKAPPSTPPLATLSTPLQNDNAFWVVFSALLTAALLGALRFWKRKRLNK